MWESEDTSSEVLQPGLLAWGGTVSHYSGEAPVRPANAAQVEGQSRGPEMPGPLDLCGESGFIRARGAVQTGWRLCLANRNGDRGRGVGGEVLWAQGASPGARNAGRTSDLYGDLGPSGPEEPCKEGGGHASRVRGHGARGEPDRQTPRVRKTGKWCTPADLGWSGRPPRAHSVPRTTPRIDLAIVE